MRTYVGIMSYVYSLLYKLREQEKAERKGHRRPLRKMKMKTRIMTDHWLNSLHTFTYLLMTQRAEHIHNFPPFAPNTFNEYLTL